MPVPLFSVIRPNDLADGPVVGAAVVGLRQYLGVIHVEIRSAGGRVWIHQDELGTDITTTVVLLATKRALGVELSLQGTQTSLRVIGAVVLCKEHVLDALLRAPPTDDAAVQERLATEQALWTVLSKFCGTSVMFDTLCASTCAPHACAVQVHSEPFVGSMLPVVAVLQSPRTVVFPNGRPQGIVQVTPTWVFDLEARAFRAATPLAAALQPPQPLRFPIRGSFVMSESGAGRTNLVKQWLQEAVRLSCWPPNNTLAAMTDSAGVDRVKARAALVLCLEDRVGAWQAAIPDAICVRTAQDWLEVTYERLCSAPCVVAAVDASPHDADQAALLNLAGALSALMNRHNLLTDFHHNVPLLARHHMYNIGVRLPHTPALATRVHWPVRILDDCVGLAAWLAADRGAPPPNPGDVISQALAVKRLTTWLLEDSLVARSAAWTLALLPNLHSKVLPAWTAAAAPLLGLPTSIPSPMAWAILNQTSKYYLRVPREILQRVTVRVHKIGIPAVERSLLGLRLYAEAYEEEEAHSPHLLRAVHLTCGGAPPSLGMPLGNLVQRQAPMTAAQAMQVAAQHYDAVSGGGTVAERLAQRQVTGDVAESRRAFFVRRVQAAPPPECPVCMEGAARNVPLCGHGLCDDCFAHVINEGEWDSCGVCRTPLSVFDWIHLLPPPLPPSTQPASPARTTEPATSLSAMSDTTIAAQAAQAAQNLAIEPLDDDEDLLERDSTTTARPGPTEAAARADHDDQSSDTDSSLPEPQQAAACVPYVFSRLGYAAKLVRMCPTRGCSGVLVVLPSGLKAAVVLDQLRATLHGGPHGTYVVHGNGLPSLRYFMRRRVRVGVHVFLLAASDLSAASTLLRRDADARISRLTFLSPVPDQRTLDAEVAKDVMGMATRWCQRHPSGNFSVDVLSMSTLMPEEDTYARLLQAACEGASHQDVEGHYESTQPRYILRRPTTNQQPQPAQSVATQPDANDGI